MHIRRAMVGVVCVVALCGAGRADEVDEIVQAAMARQHIPGAAVAVVRQGAVIKTGAYGVANVELQAPVRTDTVFQLCSITKEFVATGIMMLVEEGKVKLDDPVSNYLVGTPAAWKNVTVRHLLTHTSGIPDAAFQSEGRRADASEKDVLGNMAAKTLNFEPGKRWEYSNTNYVALGMIIRKVSGMWVGDFLRKRIFEPLEMSRTIMPHDGQVIAGRAAGYVWNGKEVQGGGFTPEGVMGAAGGIRSTVLDMAKWDAAIDSARLLKQSTLDQMWTAVKPVQELPEPVPHYGLGFELYQPANGHRALGHGGGHYTGFRTEYYRLADDRLTVIVLTNLSSTNIIRLSRQIAGVYLPEVAPPVYRPIPDQEPDVTARVRGMIDSAAAGTLKSADFALPLWGLITLQKKEIQEATKGLGAIGDVTLVDRSDHDQMRSYRYRVTCKNDTMLLHVEIDASNKFALVAPEEPVALADDQAPQRKSSTTRAVG